MIRLALSRQANHGQIGRQNRDLLLHAEVELAQQEDLAFRIQVCKE
jgi:hypothetical protein